MNAREREETLMQALKVLYAYRLSIQGLLRGEILEMDVESDSVEGNIPGMLASYRNLLWRVEVAEGALRAGIKKAAQEAGMASGEFLCLRCKMRIKQGDKACRICGWSWVRYST